MATLAIYISFLFLLYVGLSVSWEPEIPPECKHTTVCDIKHITNYPTKWMNETIWKYKKAGYIPMTELDDKAYEPPPTLGPNDVDLCESVLRPINVGSAWDIETKSWRAVVNDPHKPLQILNVELCKNENSECNPKSKDDKSYFKSNIMTLRHGYGSRCVQKFFNKALLGLSATGGPSWFVTKVPMCCSCVPYRL